IVNERERPLVLYLFSRNRRVIRDVLARTSAGGTAINDTLVHFYQLHLPFGGIGNSGVGKGHGFFGFEAFSNARGVLEQPTRFSAIQLLYPPYNSRWKQKLIDWTIKYFLKIGCRCPVAGGTVIQVPGSPFQRTVATGHRQPATLSSCAASSSSS
ncbi:MAG TPA: aldehyde dehydrogenase family protein, partial [Thermoanaerobaculia bacterium]|nr:aldehyde dehydrogenase family protein [Thermoanaerobaculia bacterium]